MQKTAYRFFLPRPIFRMAAGAKTIAAIDLVPSRPELAKELGVTHAINICLVRNSRCSIEIIDRSRRGSGGLPNFLISHFGEQEVDLCTEQDGKTRKVKPYV